MLDLVSTRAGASEQDIACARLVTSIIVEAVRDASEPLSAEERLQRRNMNPRARMALRFLFSPTSVFSGYARLIGSNAAAIRSGLLTAESPFGSPFSDQRRRSLRARYEMYQQTDSTTL